MRSGVRGVAGLTVLAIAWLVAGCAAHRPPSAGIEALAPPEARGVGVGDVITIQFWRQPDLSGQHTVNQEGRIFLPLVQGVDVAGLSAEQIRTKLTSLYTAYYDNPLIVVNVKLGVNVTGAVMTPGRYTVDPSFTLFDALGLAGGLAHEANRRDVELIRDGKRYSVDLDDALISMHRESLRLQSADWVYVPRRFWTLQRVATYGTIAVIVLQIITIATR